MPYRNDSMTDSSDRFASLCLGSFNPEGHQSVNWRAQYDFEDTIAGAPDDVLDQDYFMADPDQLRDSITEELSQTPIGLTLQGQYLSDDRLKALFTIKAVQNALGRRTDRELAHYVIQHARRTFATLLLVFSESKKRSQAMQSFQSTHFTDATLTRALPTDASKGLKLCRDGACFSLNPSCEHHFPYKNPWSEFFLAEFKKKSSNFQIEKFEQSVFTYEMNRDLHLPIVKIRNDIGSKSGHFSEVTCVEILTDKQDKVKSASTSIVVALKTLKRLSDKEYNINAEWRREAGAYRRLNDKSKQIVQGIAAVRLIDPTRQNDTYHLILEWADGGNLQDFQKNHPQRQLGNDPGQNRRRTMELLEQLCGLAEALQYMHSSNVSTPGHSRTNTSSLSLHESFDSGQFHGNPIDTLPSPFMDRSAPPKIEVQGPDDLHSHTSSSVHGPDTPSPDALLSAHLLRRGTSLHSENWRHGDIKPENILRFLDGKQSDGLGTLKLADLGRAQLHEQITRKRTTSDEKELWRTRWYEPPDLFDAARKKISRLFDIWSIGCVIFESVLWFLHGMESIEEFVSANELATNEPFATPYWKKTRNGRFEVTATASTWMNHILQKDPERDCALGDVVKLVQERLLQIDIPDDSEFYSPGYRTNAEDLRQQLEVIIGRAKVDERYLFSGMDRSNVPIPQAKKTAAESISTSSTGSSLSPHDAEKQGSKRVQGRATTIAQQRVYTNTLRDDWTTDDDASFVNDMMRDREYFKSEPECCEDCKDIDILLEEVSFVTANLRSNAEDKDCDLCELVHGILRPVDVEDNDTITLERSDDCFVLRGTNEKLLRLCQTSTNVNSAQTNIPIAAPILPVAPAELTSDCDGGFVKLLRAWLRSCDEKHTELCKSSFQQEKLPRRLINVKSQNRPKVVETRDLDPKDSHNLRYVAFSHRWGIMPAGAVTTAENVIRRMKKLPTDELPKSFLDAIAVANVLGCDYLWIDSICILQGLGGDFNDEADTMQDTFSNAYCVIAACDADGSSNGFLRRKPSKTMQKDGVYLSTVTDDFVRDVLQSPLNRRGWVLQERALARRTIFFTKSQMYFECGDGIRCETLAKLKNDEVAFLGDPNFPNYTIRENSTRGSQIHLFTRLFEMYSKLELSHPEDKPIAIDGLMHRLTTAFKTHSLAGLFDAFWGRCLLWRRAGPRPLRRIPPGPHTKRMPPTWSWMAFEGAIAFLDPVGDTVDWNGSVRLPYDNRAQSSWLKTSNRGESNALRAHVFALSPAVHNAAANEAYIVFDGALALPIETVKCFVVGTEKQAPLETAMRRHFVVLVSKKQLLDEVVSYERVGVGCVLGKYIRFGGEGPASID